ncbi:ATP-binding cassette domain-containing protein, partial [Pseudochrobactrum sp. AO18b]|uniref:ATP-binding cassette domain-containing protein n=1 Tax=Pseudochrobactrum sp. AO18b TaxID=1201036 RepID=UPI0004802EE6
MTALLEVRDLVRDYTLPKQSLLSKPQNLRVLHGVSLSLKQGESLGIVGESGSGKSTLARSVMGLEKPQSGSVTINGKDIYSLGRGGV